MIHLRVERSPVRQFLMGVAGLVLVIAAFDILWIHELSGSPGVGDDGNLTSRGIVERRQDILWGSVLFVAGGVLLITAIAGLALRRPVVELTDDELRLRVGGPWKSGGPFRMYSIPWDEVITVRSGTDESDGWLRSRVLIVEVEDPSVLPDEPWGADWDGGLLRLDADSWQVPPEEVAIRSELLLRRKGRAAPDELGA